MEPRSVVEIPRTQSRLRWGATIRAGVDLEDLLGIPSGASDAFAAGASAFRGTIGDVFNRLEVVGTIDSIEVVQQRTIRERYALGPNALQSFQTIPQQVSYTLEVSRVVLKKLPKVEALFNFFPQNLAFQQLPFIVELRDIGDGSAETEIRHLFFGCWFANSRIKYDTTKEDTRLIQTATIKTGRCLTFDPSVGGNPALQLTSSLISAGIAPFQEEISDTISDLGLG